MKKKIDQKNRWKTDEEIFFHRFGFPVLKKPSIFITGLAFRFEYFLPVSSVSGFGADVYFKLILRIQFKMEEKFLIIMNWWNSSNKHQFNTFYLFKIFSFSNKKTINQKKKQYERYLINFLSVQFSKKQTFFNQYFLTFS